MDEQVAKNFAKIQIVWLVIKAERPNVIQID